MTSFFFEQRSAQYLIDSGKLILDIHTLSQLHLYSLTHGYASPLWMTTAYARRHGYSTQPLCAPLNVWAPGCGETFTPAFMPHFSTRAGQHGDRFPALPDPPSVYHRGADVYLCVRWGAAHNGAHDYRWCACPKAFEPLFLAQGLHRLWACASAVFDSGDTGTPQTPLTVRTPYYHVQLLNADQLVECEATCDLAAHHHQAFLCLRAAADPIVDLR